MNKKAFVNPLGIFLLYLIFLALWFLVFASAITYWTQQAIVTNDLVGLEAFLLDNLNFFVFIIATLTLIAGSYATME